MQITITEALAEIHVITKKLESKRQFIRDYLWRQALVRDPHEKSGGSPVLLEREQQACNDLEMLLVTIRRAIQEANLKNTITVMETEMSITDWLTFRREVAPDRLQFLKDLSKRITNLRASAMQKGVMVTGKDDGIASQDFIVHIDEAKLASGIEKMETILATLDGQLSLKNATITIEI